MLPPHNTYVEPFGGELNVLLNKPRSQIEIAGDIHVELIQFYKTLQDSPNVLIDQLSTISYTRESFDWGCAPTHTTDAITAAIQFLIKYRFSRGGLGKTFAWSDRLRGGQPGDVNGWKTILIEMPTIARRLNGVEIYHADALDLIAQYDGPETLFYLDPPYLPSTRTAKKAYQHEMSQDDHQRLLNRITRLQGMVVLSGYNNPLYNRVLDDWKRYEFNRPNHSGQGKVKQRRIEILWLSRRH